VASRENPKSSKKILMKVFGVEKLNFKKYDFYKFNRKPLQRERPEKKEYTPTYPA
jgi:hypothetical protein